MECGHILLFHIHAISEAVDHLCIADQKFLILRKSACEHAVLPNEAMRA